MNAELENLGGGLRETGGTSARDWFKRFLAGNPFYIVSAAFLLYGIYRISMEPQFEAREMVQLLFNFSALHLYGFLLIVTALFLAWRRIWYDSTLLVVIESALLLIPFLLVSQAISLSQGTDYLLCGLTALFAGIRFSLLKMFYPQLNLPLPLLAAGAAIVAVNGFLPVLFKAAQDTGDAAMALDVQEAGVKFVLNGILPVLAVLAMFLPRAGGPLPPEKKWLPLLIHFLWITATGVHIYSIQYVYRAPFQPDFFLPTAWVAAWVVTYRARQWISAQAKNLRHWVLALPAIVTLPLLWPGRTELSGYFLVCNLVLYAAIAFRERPNQVAQHLTVLSAAAALVEVPGAVWHGYWAASNPGAWMFCWAAAYALFAALISRNPKLGVAGAICAGFAAALLFRNFDATAPIALQVAFGFLLLHSIAWHDADERGAATARIMAAAGWVIHSLWWAHSQELFSFVVPATVSAAIACGCFALILLGKIPAPRVLLIAAAVVLISTPANLSLEKARTASPGVMFVVGSFVLFAVGTVFALGKHRWLKETPASKMTETAADDYPE